MKVLKYPTCNEGQLYRKQWQWNGGQEAHSYRGVKAGGDQENLHRGIALSFNRLSLKKRTCICQLDCSSREHEQGNRNKT